MVGEKYNCLYDGNLNLSDPFNCSIEDCKTCGSNKSELMINKFIKKIGPTLATASLILAFLVGWDQLTVSYARAEDVKRNQEHLYVLTDVIKTFVEESTKTRLFVQMDRVDSQIYDLERKYYGSKTMSEQVKKFYARLLQEKKDIQKRLDK